MFEEEGVIKGTLSDVEELYYYVRKLKKVKRHLLHNMYLSNEAICRLIQKQRLFFIYKEGSYLNIFVKEWDFVRLFYYIADVERYDIPTINCNAVADLFVQGDIGSIDNAICLLGNRGFSKYAMFTRYVKEAAPEDERNSISPYISDGVTKDFYGLLKDCFDRYTDYIPQEDEAADFFSNHYCYSYVEDGTLHGGAVISLKGTIATAEFIFVSPEARHRGVFKALNEYWCSKTAEKNDTNVKRFIAWVNDLNGDSWKHCIHNGFKRENIHKVTMIKYKG